MTFNELTILPPETCPVSLHSVFEGRPDVVDFRVKSTTSDDFNGLVWALVDLASMALDFRVKSTTSDDFNGLVWALEDLG